MTLRDYFAAKALNGLLREGFADSRLTSSEAAAEGLSLEQYVARRAGAYADAMFAERQQANAGGQQ
ncbi:hypothetical protein HNR46_001315 [Haloferula luteola]|uniref:Uncharacterized protein n=1 Tax=Haloferula luteola TaxID=595692 RepID=A0A840VE15_9BACT|nr:hypothetical protein [Haloferula luteola]MBB5351081.1 hypothetical protein [Haloferula luteola]